MWKGYHKLEARLYIMVYHLLKNYRRIDLWGLPIITGLDYCLFQLYNLSCIGHARLFEYSRGQLNLELSLALMVGVAIQFGCEN